MNERPPRSFSEKSQAGLNMLEAVDELRTVIPERCADCLIHLRGTVVLDVALRVAKTEITLDEGQQQIRDYANSCQGLQRRDLLSHGLTVCPKQSEQKRHA